MRIFREFPKLDRMKSEKKILLISIATYPYPSSNLTLPPSRVYGQVYKWYIITKLVETADAIENVILCCFIFIQLALY